VVALLDDGADPAVARLGEMADEGDFDEFLGNKQAYRR
jgi:hypothetical protein